MFHLAQYLNRLFTDNYFSQSNSKYIQGITKTVENILRKIQQKQSWETLKSKILGNKLLNVIIAAKNVDGFMIC